MQREAGIQWYVVDTPEEVIKIAAIKPDAKLYVRTEVSNEGSLWPLAGKFGASASGIQSVIEKAKEHNMKITGVTFHVGSQCTNIKNWIDGIQSAKRIFAQLEASGWTPELLNLGGGYPVQFTGEEPSIAEIGEVISKELEDYSPVNTGNGRTRTFLGRFSRLPSNSSCGFSNSR